MTNKKRIYLELYNLNESSSLDDIKKRYRELAKEFHPDRNKDSNAHERFLLIKEAYEYLITNQVENSHSVYFDNINLEKERIEKIRIAKERLKEFYRRKEVQKLREINAFFNSRLWRFYKLLSLMCLAYSLINIVDYILPKQKVKTIVSEISEEYNDLLNDKILLIKPLSTKSFFINNQIYRDLIENDSIIIFRSILLNKINKLNSKKRNEIKIYININNSLGFNVLFSSILFFPFLIFIYKKEELGYIFVVKLTISIITPLFIYIVMNIFI